MSHETTLDLYRIEVEAPRAEHYFHYLPGQKRVLSTEQFFKRTCAIADGLEQLGVTAGDRVMLLSDNRPEWHMVDLAVADLGAADVPLYGTLTPPQVAYQAKDSGAVAAVVESPEQMAKLLAVRAECPDLKHLIQIEGERATGVLSFDEVASGGGDSAGDRFWDRAKKVDEGSLLTLIYTSGTTGNPKGVTLTHRNLVQNVVASNTRAPIDGSDVALEFLPLCHVLERMLSYLYMSKATARAYCSVQYVGEMVSEIRPTVFAGVPRFFEKVHDKVLGKVAAAPALRQAMFAWARGAGEEYTPHLLAGTSPGFALGLKHALADKLVLAKVRQAFGGRLRLCVSGGAPLPAYVNSFFHALGIRVLEGYGLTETSPVIAVNGTGNGMTRIGTVGKPIDNVEVKIAADGEIVVRGPNVMSGYWKLPDKTAEVFDADGFFHTGDIGELDADGFLKITDRKKDLIVTGGGKNIAPQPIENELKRSPYVDNAVLIGDGKKFVSCLLSPNTEALEPWAKDQGLTWTSIGELTTKPAVIALYQEVVDRTNEGLARYEQVKRFAVLPLMLSIEGGHLTPTMKVKRRVVEKEYQALIDGFYA